MQVITMPTPPARALAAKLTPEEMGELKRLAAYERGVGRHPDASSGFATLHRLHLAEMDARGDHRLSEFGREVLAYLPP